ncbi:MAG TPA: hypothetical protein VM183_20820 [Burkholderiales bacterium]|nr:hypothetical protein [Burkholderiales bacterium]
MRKPLAVAVAAALSGCSTPPPVDNTPENPTAVFETRVSSTGIAGNFPFETTEKRFVRADMQREERATKGTGRFSGFLVTRVIGGPGDTNIARLDRKLLWTVNERRKEYVECPLAGCPLPGGAEAPAKPEAQQPEQPKQKTEEGCTTRISSNRFDVKPTGQKRDVNGFSAEQYEGAWVIRMEDKQKRATTSTMKFDIWTSPINGEMKKAIDTETAFARTYMASVPQSAMPMMHGKPGEQPVLPPEIMAQMTGYLGTLSATDRAAFTRAAKELEKIKGHPVSTKIDWFVDGNACGAKDEEQKQQQSSSPTSISGALMSGAMGMLNKKEEKPAGPQPIFSFTVEVKQMGVVPVRDSVFNVPASYKKAN